MTIKKFSKYVLATIVGTLITLIIVVLIGAVCMVGILSREPATASVKDGSVLLINLDGAITETTDDNPLAVLLGRSAPQTGLNDLLEAIKKAQTNDKIQGIYLEAGALVAGYSTLRELRQALTAFKTSGKWVVAYGDSYTQGAYYVASVADQVYLNPSGELDLHGVASRVVYVKDLYAKLGIHFQVIKVGKYKSATEAYSEEKMSDANREQLTAITSGMWADMRQAIATSRNVEESSIDSLADRFTAFVAPSELVAAGLVDSLLYSDEIKAVVKKKLGMGEDDNINQLSVADMRTVKGEKKQGEKIAVYYAEGDIVDTEIATLPTMGGASIVGDKVCKDLDQLIDDDEVAAVVLRVNSPGGSAYASEQIWHRVERLKEKKPVVVSMGDYAASGGYYISCAASWIVAQPTTLTGSIGIFGIIPEASELLKKHLALHFDGVQTNKHSDLGGSMLNLAIRPLDDEEHELLQKYIDRGYALFRQRVADGRQQPIDDVEAVAQGHVWLGQEAIDIHLVDQLGGIDDAIAMAAQLANVDTYYTQDYPEKRDWLDELLYPEEKKSYLDAHIRQILGEWYEPALFLKTASDQHPVQARLPFLLTIN